MRCAVCGFAGPGIESWSTVGGPSYGMACRGECAALLWEAHFVRVAHPGDAYEAACMVWKWRRRRSEVEGVRFAAPPPVSPGERAVSLAIAAKGWTDIARELS